ncbi:hypothetical protein [Arenibaculum pallidiluteum]|uniref:hypothetical protein n=1 Tax=Arenibaculum pallidiluteum TaxID=2812559 RepID=UPI001A96B81F|nr:hypothetical protein [Arenibaculum pallidiluteum]
MARISLARPSLPMLPQMDLVRALVGLWTRRRPALDPDTLTEGMRQDLGLSEGRFLRPRDPYRD